MRRLLGGERPLEYALVAIGFAAVALLTVVWLSMDRRPPEWDHANHLDRARLCARDVAVGDLRSVILRSGFYPPLVLCSAGALQRALGSDEAAAGTVMLGFLAVGMAATYLLARRIAGGPAGVVAALLFATAPYVVFSVFRFQLDLPLTAMVALALEVLVRTNGFTRAGWSVAAGVMLGLGMLTKPPFAVYVLPAMLWAVARIRDRGAAVNAAATVVTAGALSIVWYAPRLLGLGSQISGRSFGQAAEAGFPHPFTWASLSMYPAWLPTQFGAAATVLFIGGLVVAVRRRQWWLLLTLGVPFGVFELLMNKNLRYTLPLLPLAAVVAALGWSAVWRPARVLVTLALAAIAVLQVSVTAFDRPSGVRVPGIGVPLAFASAPVRDDWRHDEILTLIARDSGGAPATVSVVPNHPFFSVANFRYYGLRDRYALSFARAWDQEPVGIEYMIVKSGDIGPAYTASKIRRVMDRLTADPYLRRVFPVIGEFPLPDGSVGSVLARRIAALEAAVPATLAAEVRAAFARRLEEFARDVDGLDIALVYDERIRQGRITRLEIRAASATVAEYRRANAGRLRVRDLHLRVDDLLVNPFSAFAEQRLNLLDVGPVRVDRATIAAADLGDFLDTLPKFRATVRLERGWLAVTVRQFGPDISGRVTVRAAADRPFALAAERVTVGGVVLPSALVDWVLWQYDPSVGLARRLPMPVSVGTITIDPEAIRVASDG